MNSVIPRMVAGAALMSALATLPMAAIAGERVLDALAGFVRIDDNTYKTIVMLPGETPLGTYCGSEWSYGFIQAKMPIPGCWGLASQNPAERNFEFRYMTPSSVGVKSFRVSVDQLQRLKYDTETDNILPPY